MISYLSKPKAVAMADEWFQFATTDHFWIKWRFEALLKFQNLLPEKGARILEIGCGNGLFLKQLKSLEFGYELHGCAKHSRTQFGSSRYCDTVRL